MIALTHDQEEHVRSPLDIWSEDCKSNPNTRISGSFPVQIYTLLANIQTVVPTAEAFTYDLDKDPAADPAAPRDIRKEFENLWYALAYYLKVLEGASDRQAYMFAEHQWKSLRSGAYGLQTACIAAERSCFITSQSVDNRDSRIITLNGGYETLSGATVAEVAGGREKKRWEAQTAAIFIKGGVDTDRAKALASNLSPTITQTLEQEHRLKLDVPQ